MLLPLFWHNNVEYILFIKGRPIFPILFVVLYMYSICLVDYIQYLFPVQIQSSMCDQFVEIGLPHNLSLFLLISRIMTPHSGFEQSYH